MRFDCGCEIDAPNFDPDIQYLNLQCPATWDLICSGNTKGVFQLSYIDTRCWF